MSDIEREAFEQAVADKWSDSYSFTRFGDEDYYDEVLEGMWQGWQASRQIEGEPVAWWDGDTSAAEDSFSFKSNGYYTIPLYTHPASRQAVSVPDMWRDVDYEVPEQAQEVILVLGEKVVHGAWIGGMFWHNNRKVEATKWRPLPQPPNQEGQ